MEIDDTRYDIDNVDIEEAMEAQDIEEEQEAADDERERIEYEKVVEEAKKNSKKINTQNMDNELMLLEPDRKHFNISYKGDKFKVLVLYKFNDNEYLFDAKDLSTGEVKMRKFKLSDIKQ